MISRQIEDSSRQLTFCCRKAAEMRVDSTLNDPKMIRDRPLQTQRALHVPMISRERLGEALLSHPEPQRMSREMASDWFILTGGRPNER
jgi:hypothetical protein